MDRFLETSSGSLTQVTKLLARKAMMAPAASCDDSMISTTQDNPRDGLIFPQEDPIIRLQTLSRAGMRTSTGWGGAQRVHVRNDMGGEPREDSGKQTNHSPGVPSRGECYEESLSTIPEGLDCSDKIKTSSRVGRKSSRLGLNSTKALLGSRSGRTRGRA